MNYSDYRRHLRNYLRTPEELVDAKNRRFKGKFPGYAGYRQRGRAEARIAKRRRARLRRRTEAYLIEEELC